MRFDAAISLLASVLALGGQAEDKPKSKSSPPAPKDVATAKFVQVLAESADYFQKLPAYEVEVTAPWQAQADGKERKGENRFRLVASRPGKFRIEARSSTKGPPDLVCVGDGKIVTTYLPGRELHMENPPRGPVEGLKANPLLAMTLAGSGLDIMIRPDVKEYVLNEVSHISYVGETDLEGAPTRHFKMLWGETPVELWIAAGPSPLLRQFKRTVTIPAKEGKPFQLVTTARLTWQLKPSFAEDAFVARPSPQSKKVDDLYAALAKTQGASMVGRALPAIALIGPDGAKKIVPGKGDVLVVTFWTTWCAQSTERLEALRTIEADYARKGVRFLSVNVNEEAATAKARFASKKLPGQLMMDPDGSAAAALGVTAIPVTLVIGPDSVVRFLSTGSDAADLPKLTAVLDTLRIRQ